MIQRLLVSAKTSAEIDARAHDWGFDEYALVEAAGRACAKHCHALFDRIPPGVVVVAGAGNNGADALVMLRALLLSGELTSSSSTVVLSRAPDAKTRSPFTELLKSLKKMNVPVFVWEEDEQASETALVGASLIIDGIAGTGIKGPLAGNSEKIVRAVNSLKEMRGKDLFIVSIDIPSGNSDEWKLGMPILKADATLSIEPQKHCLYNPPARVFAGKIISVGGVFPSILLRAFDGAELFDWDCAGTLIPPVKPDAYKHERGSVEIRAGASGTTGAAVIAALGAQASGAGLIRLVVDDDIYPIAASALGGSNPGIMVYPESKRPLNLSESSGCDALLLGPGWGKGEDRKVVFEKALAQEKKGLALILDADAIGFAKDTVFNNNCILTPHPGEFALLSGAAIDEVISQPIPLLLETAKEKKAVIILKGHVINIAAPDGRWGIVDGMAPVLASGGSGDLLAGFCAALSARSMRSVFDAYTCAAAASSLLIAAGKTQAGFTDPSGIAEAAASLAGLCWLEGRMGDNHG